MPDVLVPVRDPGLFAQAKVGFGGRSVDWIEDELDLGSDNLRHIAVEQAGGQGPTRWPALQASFLPSRVTDKVHVVGRFDLTCHDIIRTLSWAQCQKLGAP